MVVLKIFNVHENVTEKPLSTFGVGEYVVGRGSFANCVDKTISRRHIKINVTDNEATLTLVHISPIFFMSKNSPHIQILKKDNSILLADGDKFAFLIDTWYTFKIEENEKDNNNLAGSSSSVIPASNPISSNTVIASKCNTIISQSTSCKRSTEELYSEERKKLKLHNENLDKLKDNIDKIVSGDYQNSPDDNQSSASEVANNNTTEVFKGKDISDSDDEDSDTEVLAEVARDVEIVNGVRDNLDENSESHNTEDVKKSEILADLKKEPMIEDDNKLILKTEPQEDESTNTVENSIPEVPYGSVKNSKMENETTVETSENNEAVKIENQDPADASASSSRTSHRVKREKCWYGQNCYRKNPGHKEQFCHPGDSDHDEESDDDRPQCPYGGQCYRRNAQHWKDCKHPTSRPAPRPSTSKRSNIQVFNIFNGACPYCEHCRQRKFGGGKDDPSSGPGRDSNSTSN